MLLRKLELQGYKTFASRTEFLFESGITAIVGPNGSGKSNIADAIRWVLGEQSYSLLRGKKTEDMIFSGTQRRGRSGLAQATIVLDNDDGHLPVAFSEVAISRRAYRSGENEYLLNGSRVRLRDINELLAASGLGQRTYNVIGQGLVDAALSLRADERRKLFEEAAGIALYKERREDALARLEATQRNLERVGDILSEINPRMRRLERQAARSREYDQVNKDLESLLYVWYGFRWANAKQNLREARTESRQADEALRASRTAQSELETAVAALRQEAAELRGQLADLHSQSGQLDRDAELLRRTLAVHGERSRLLAQQQAELEAELESLRHQRGPLAQQYKQAARELERIGSIGERRQEAVDQAGRALEAGRAEASQLQEQLRELQHQAIVVESQISTTDESQNALVQREEELSAEEQVLRRAMELETAEQLRSRQDLEALQRRLEDESARVADVESEEELLRQRRGAMQEELRGLIDERQRLDTLAAELDARHQAIKEMRESGAGHEAAAQRILAALDRPLGIVGAVAQLLEVPAELEKAVSAVLASELSTIVVEERAIIQQISRFMIERGEAGRLSLLPLDDVRPAAKLSLEENGWDSLPGVIGIAADAVGCQTELRPIVELLLGRVLLVRSREHAAGIAPALPTGSRAVSLDGFVAHQDGRIMLPGEVEAGSLLAQERKWRELPAKRAENIVQVEAAKSKIASAESELGVLKNELDRQGAAVARIRQQRQATNALREAAVLQLDRLGQSLTWREEQLQRVGDAAKKVREERSRLEENRLGLRQQLEGLRLSSSKLIDRLDGIPLVELESHLTAQERALAQTVGMRRNQETVAQTLGTALRQLDEQLTARQQRANEVADQRGQLVATTESEHQQEQSLALSIASLSERIAPAEDRTADIDAHLGRLSEQEGRLRRQIRTSEEIASRANLVLDRARTELEHLRQRIRDELGLVHLPLDEDMEGQTPLPLGDVVGHLPVITELPTDLEGSIQRRRQQLKRMGPINPDAPAEFAELKERQTFLNNQINDLREADGKLRQVIAELDELMERDFRQTFNAVASEFSRAFTRLFGGGSARLLLSDPDNPVHSGVEILARPPDRRQQGLALLSGGERSLTAAALIFALLKVSPTPFCVLDEVDAMLDEANVGRFGEMLVELSQRTQFIIISHSRGTIQSADTIYGISMGTDGASQVISLRLEGERLAAPEP